MITLLDEVANKLAEIGISVGEASFIASVLYDGGHLATSEYDDFIIKASKEKQDE